MRFFLVLFLLLTVAGPLYVILTENIDFTADYRTASRNTAHLAPDPDAYHDAVIQVYSARTFNWRGIFSVHTWIATKIKNGNQYHVYQLIGWRLYRNLPPLVTDPDIPDRLWFDQTPTVILDIRGQKAEELIPEISKAAKTYPYPDQYTYWPGPNSNTFIAYVGRQIPGLELAMPSNAVGKDYLMNGAIFSRAPSCTGYQISLYGVLGLMLAKREGFELNLFGLVYGFSPTMLILKLPGFGDINFSAVRTLFKSNAL